MVKIPEESERWRLDETPKTGASGQYWKIQRKEAFRQGIFADCIASFDFNYQNDAKRMLVLLEALEALIEANIADAITNSLAARVAFYKPNKGKGKIPAV